MKKFLLICVFLLAGVPISAKTASNIYPGDVYYCVSTAFSKVDRKTNWLTQNYSAEKFILKTTEKEIVVKGGTFFVDERKYEIRNPFGDPFGDLVIIEASSNFEKIYLDNNDFLEFDSDGRVTETPPDKAKFIYTFTFATGIIALTADCEKFK